LERLIQDAAPMARVEIRWKMKPNLEEAANLLLSDKDKIGGKAIQHAWIGTIVSDESFAESKYSIVFPLTISIFGFILSASGVLRDGLTSEDILDDERREIQRLIGCNQSFLAMDNPQGLHGVTIPQFGGHDVVRFGGVDCNSVEGLMNVRLREQYVQV
jgi:hypothetical protein